MFLDPWIQFEGYINNIYIYIYPAGRRMFFKPSFGNDCFLGRTPVFTYHPASCQDNFFVVLVSVVQLWLRASGVMDSRFTISFHAVNRPFFQNSTNQVINLNPWNRKTGHIRIFTKNSPPAASHAAMKRALRRSRGHRSSYLDYSISFAQCPDHLV